MRLASKIFLTSSLAILALAVVGVLSLGAVGRLVSVNREITTETVPALRLATGTRDAMRSLGRLEARFLILRDTRYAALWSEKAERVQEDLRRLHDLVPTDRERVRLGEAVAAFDEYQATFAAARARLAARGRVTPVAPEPALVERVEAALDGLMEATHARVTAARAEAAGLEASTWTGVIVALLAAVTLALVGAGVVAFGMTRSLRSLSAATAAVAAGSFREPLADERRDEIGELARSFNSMAAQLRRMEETKEEFFATLSHELRSPLTSVREAALLLADEVPGPLNDKQARLVQLVEQSTDRLLGLVNQILELSRLRAGALPLERVPVELERVVTRAVEELRPRAEEAGIALELERVGERFPAVGDEGRLVQVVVNLLANAIRFTDRGGHVVVRVVDAGNEVEIQVEDTGMGIPAGALPHIFDAYRQAHRARGGSGLGLAVVRGLVEAHGGCVTVESQEGKGSRFTVLLPRRRSSG